MKDCRIETANKNLYRVKKFGGGFFKTEKGTLLRKTKVTSQPEPGECEQSTRYELVERRGANYYTDREAKEKLEKVKFYKVYIIELSSGNQYKIKYTNPLEDYIPEWEILRINQEKICRFDTSEDRDIFVARGSILVVTSYEEA